MATSLTMIQWLGELDLNDEATDIMAYLALAYFENKCFVTHEKFKKLMNDKIGEKDLVLIEKSQNEKSIGKDQNFFNVILDEKFDVAFSNSDFLSSHFFTQDDQITITKLQSFANQTT